LVRTLALLLDLGGASGARLLPLPRVLGLASSAAGGPPGNPACWAGQDQLAAKQSCAQLVLVPGSAAVPALWIQVRNMEGERSTITKLSERPGLWKETGSITEVAVDKATPKKNEHKDISKAIYLSSI